MTKERLQTFSSEELRVIALKAGLDVDADDKDLLIDEIIEAYEEDKMERQMATNLAMMIKQKKFELILDDDDIVLNQDDVEDPYGSQLQVNTEIRLMLRDPRWGFAYWAFSRGDQHSLNKEGKELLLRVYQNHEGAFSQLEQSDDSDPGYFDIPVSLNDSKWYINLPESGKSYFVELLAVKEGSEETLCRSNEIKSPRLYFDESFRNSIDDMVISSGLYDMIQHPEESHRNSHRILSAEESRFISQEIDK